MPAAAVIVSACGSGSSESGAATTLGDASTTSTTAGATSTTAGAVTSGEWASGGTDLISVAYPADTIFDTVTACQIGLTDATTEGPCYYQSDTGEDISVGLTGLPMQLCLQLINEDCEPLSNYTIEAWHCDTRGIYSGDTSESADAARFAGDFCTGGDAEAEAATYYRGQLTTDASGRVNFKSCFPGWYAGRTLHIHFAVSDSEGTNRVISQFCFPDEFTEDICTTHELYSDRGVQDTPLSGGTDTVFPASDFGGFMMTTEQNSDGTMLAYAVIQIDPEAVAAQADTAANGGGEPGGQGGEPPEGFDGGEGGEPPEGFDGGEGGPGGQPPADQTSTTVAS